jgi:uncharacterized damage-inducible protein DinB
MDADRFVRLLESHAAGFAAVLGSISPEEASWRPAPAKWSLLEVTAHLLDEEREDFRTRLDLTLHHPEADWPPIDPVGWVTQRAYAARGFSQTLAAFLEERSRSVTWLRGLTEPRWDREHRHPVMGSMRAGDLLAAWVAHDLRHMGQIARTRWQRVAAQARPFSVDYAG